jgi:hypothetical protein
MIETQGGEESFVTLDMLFTMRTKLSSFAHRESLKDFRDLDFLMKKFPEEIYEIADSLSADDREYFLENLTGKDHTTTSHYRRVLRIPESR